MTVVGGADNTLAEEALSKNLRIRCDTKNKKLQKKQSPSSREIGDRGRRRLHCSHGHMVASLPRSLFHKRDLKVADMTDLRSLTTHNILPNRNILKKAERLHIHRLYSAFISFTPTRTY